MTDHTAMNHYQALRRFAGAILREHRAEMFSATDTEIIEQIAADAGLLEQFDCIEAGCGGCDACYRLSEIGRRCVEEAG